MIKKFKTKKRIRNDILLKYLGLILLMLFIIKICIFLILKIPLTNFVFSYNKINKIKKYVVESTINKPIFLLDYTNIDNNITFEEENIIPTNFIQNDIKNIYIYNTHQKEGYKDNKSVLDASWYLMKKFNEMNINALVENNDITEFMRINNINYSNSYYASKFFVNDAISKNKYDLIIDLHRDALDWKTVTLETKKKNYAKILFVVGGENKNYKLNYKVANEINERIKKKYPKLTRGVIVKSGKGVDGVYNQDIADNIILLEIGSENSTFLEVQNTIDLIVPIIGEYIYEKK